ncbi:MAG: ARMT1-like domain-containing protein [bacterium]|nr:ARMT1-like domain-containing protein [bacterium]
MNVEPECVLCFYQQALNTLQFLRVHQKKKFDILGRISTYLSSIRKFKETPCFYSSKIYHLIHREIKNTDPYQQVKKQYNSLILGKYRSLQKIVSQYQDPLLGALKLSAIGNSIDFGITNAININDEIKKHKNIRFFKNDHPLLAKALKNASHVMLLCDNAGEFIFDKLLMETILRFYPVRFTLVVKDKPIINDITMKDIPRNLFTYPVDIISNGNDKVGTILSCCSAEFFKKWVEADFIISKGQGNFETLDHFKKKLIFFLFKSKCDVVSKYLQVKKNSYLFMANTQR